MGTLFDILGGPVKGLVDSVGGIIDDLSTSDEERLTAQATLLKLERDFQVSIMDADVAFAKEQAKVLEAEVASSSWLASSWRPILMLVFTYIIAHNFVIAPLFSITVVPIPEPMWELLKIGVGGYIVGRSAEKIIPATKLAKE